jgi:TolB-like protein
MEQIQAQEVRDHLDRIFASKGFAESERMRRFLRFTVESKLAAQHDRVKEYVLGREVFDRQDGYDPRVDPIVRVEARRLRAKLQEYYSGAGRDEPIRLDYEKGSYLPTFSRPKKASTGLRCFATGKLLAASAAVFAVLIVAFAVYLVSRSVQGNDTVAAVPANWAAIPARWIEPNPGDLDAADVAVAEALDSELANRQIARVLAWPVILQYQNRRKPLRQLAHDMGVAKLVLIVVRDIPPAKRVTVFLIDAPTGRKIHTNDYIRRDLSSLAAQQSLATQIAGDLSKEL